MNRRQKIETAVIAVLAAALVLSCLTLRRSAAVQTGANTQSSYIKWVDFNVPYTAMSKAMKLDIATHDAPSPVHWVEMLACLGAKYGGNWNLYRAKDMDALAAKLKGGESIGEVTANMKNYPYFLNAYDAVLGNFLGDYEIQTDDPAGTGCKIFQSKYGLKVFSPIAAGYGYGHYDDFGNSRSFGFARRHLGNDLMGTVGTPIVAVEGGTVEAASWNKYGGWRIGIRSFDKKRYYYYAHLRKGHPYAPGIKEGALVHSGDVIGYLGMTGYSTSENVNGMRKPHLHFGMQLIFDESQKEGNNEIWIDVYDIVNLLSTNRVRVALDPSRNDYTRVFEFIDSRYQLYYG